LLGEEQQTIRKAGIVAFSSVVMAGALSVIVAVMTVRLLDPNTGGPGVAAITAPTPAAVPAPSPSPAPAPLAATQPTPQPVTPTLAQATEAVQKPTDTDEQAAMELIRSAGIGDLPAALARVQGLSDQVVKTKVTRLGAVPYRSTRLVATEMLVWAEYLRAGVTVRGAYQVHMVDGKVTALEGPLAPEGGYQLAHVKPIDLNGKSVDLGAFKGRGVVLVAPRIPELGLDEALVTLQKQFAPLGVEVVLALDIGAPDWAGTAARAGFTGTVWRFKSRLDDVPMLNKGRWLGAVGLLIDREGYAVASLTALDPSRYDSQAPDPTQIFKAYGLLP
jgi:hypothetical protein